MKLNREALEKDILAIGTEVFQEMSTHSPSKLDPYFYTDKMMSWAMEDEELKVSLFRFVDVLANLNDSASVIEHAQEYFEPLGDKIPGFFRKALGISPTALTSKLAARTIRKQISFVAERFIVGESPQKALRKLRKIRKKGLAFTVDLVGETAVSELESNTYTKRYLVLLETLSAACTAWSESAPLIEGHICERTPINVSVKLSALYSQAKPISTEHTIKVLAERLSVILAKAKEVGAFVYVDMEDCALTTITIDTFKRVLEQNEFKDFADCGLVLQAYLRRTEEDINQLIAWNKKRGVPIAVRLVKGAYWDTETILAKLHGWPIPVWQQKSNSDANYEKLSLTLLQNAEIITPAFASHNVRSLAHAIAAANALGVKKTDFELQTLYGMADEIKQVFANRGLLVREYAPIGELIPGMGYLVRRLLENTSNEGFLQQSGSGEASLESLLVEPPFDPNDTGKDHLLTTDGEFSNSPFRDFTIQGEREAIGVAISELQRQATETPNHVRIIINGETQDSVESLISSLPENPSVSLAEIDLASVDQVEEAIAQLSEYFPTWRETSVQTRVDICFQTAQTLERIRPQLTAAIILEAGKPWIEADADVAEAVDFLNYYGYQALELFKKQSLGNFDGEDNTYFFEPRGVAAVISPWNFPLAIPCGMFAAALVTGNCAILKPAEQTSYIASLLFDAFLKSGLPPEAAAFLPGRGETVGARLVEHPGISTIAFTGSRAVGLSIVEACGNVHGKSEHVKRAIVEMGGKNAIVVDVDADLDEAVKGIVYSAFGFQGQKCSACSRVYAVGDSYERLLKRLSEATKSLIVGPATLPQSFVGPVIDEESYTRINKLISKAKAEFPPLVETEVGSNASKNGYFVSPTIFAGLPSSHPIVREEIFGPVLAVQQVDSFNDAIDCALDSQYGLTGAVFSRSPKNIEIAYERFRVGNLYINRGSTGALVGRQPFGGAKMSGVGSKAGGPDYLQQFVIPRTITENTMRRGFAPMS